MGPALELALEPLASPTGGGFAIRHIVVMGDGLDDLGRAPFGVSRRGPGTEVFS